MSASPVKPPSQSIVTGGCREFRPHYSRPDKCRSCFGNKSDHQEPTSGRDSSGDAGDNKQSAASATNSDENKPASPPPATTTTTTSETGECKQCHAKQAEIDRLKQELADWQQRCRLAEEQSQRAQDELRTLESEMEELHDNFKEEENEQFEQVKQELDACLKNCKILQIRLNKAERQYGQLEQVKQMLERQLQERFEPADSHAPAEGSGCDNQANDRSAAARRRQKQQTPQQQHAYEPAFSNTDTSEEAAGQDYVKLTTREYDQMLRDLNDTSERERDLQEQIKYSQEEAQMKGERLQAIEAENELLLGRINKLTLANSSLRSSTMLAQAQQEQQQQQQQETGGSRQKLRELCEQNEQLKLALELAQSECERLRSRVQEGQRELEAREQALKETEARAKRLEAELEADRGHEQQQQQQGAPNRGPNSRLELECRQLRARLVHSERECHQLRSQLECHFGGQGAQQHRRPAGAGLSFRSHSLESSGSGPVAAGALCGSSKCQDMVRQLERQCSSLLERNNQLELKLQKLVAMSSESLEQRTSMESELIEKLKRQLDTSESELAKAKSRLVELDIECGRAQRQYKRLMSSLEQCGSSGGDFQLLRRNKLPGESARDALSRQELRQAIRDLEMDVDDLMTIIRAKECFIKERELEARRRSLSEEQQPNSSGSGQGQLEAETRLHSASNSSGGGDKGAAEVSSSFTSEQQVKSLRRLLDQEQLLSNNLKLDVANLEQDNQELKRRRQALERERVAMEEELDKLRQLLGELRAELEESQSEKQRAQSRSRELGETVERLKLELEEARRLGADAGQQLKAAATTSGADNEPDRKADTTTSSAAGKQRQTDLLVMARDLSELKVKNGFLMRQLELAREDTGRQLDELKAACEAQQRRAVELAQIELKERHLQESQQLRDELNDLKQKLGQLTRQLARQEEETNAERDRARGLERDWRRDKSQWQQAREQLEGQLVIEKRSSEFRLKEAEAAIKDKERSLTSVQDRCVQLERDLKRLQNKYRLLEEDSESKIKQLSRDLEMRTKDLNELARQKQTDDEQHYEKLRRLNEDKLTLKETLDTIRRSYDERLAETRQLRELLQSRQQQAYKERAQLIERVDALTRRVNELGDQETQAKLLKQRLETHERQLESLRRELSFTKEERTKLRARCDELEKRELITKTSSISGLSPAHHHHHASSSGGNSASFLRPFNAKVQLVGRPAAAASEQHSNRAASPVRQDGAVNQTATGNGEAQQLQSMVEKLSGKINDQRNLINMLRQQLTETQMELKQAKLLQASERSRWQTNVAMLTGRLNECEEKLAFETMLLQANANLVDQLARPKLDANWSLERQANLELIKQQQTQIELLTRDLKKTSQAHDLLRLHTKQLETHNNKLSKKLIDYQQQSSFASQHDKRLESSYRRLLERHSQLTQDTRPLIEIVAKIVGSLDAPEQAAAAGKTPSAAATPGTRGRGDSTERPLRAGVPLGAARPSAQQPDSDESDAGAEPPPPSTVIASAKPAHQMNKSAQQQPTRLARLLAGGTTKPHARDGSTSPTGAAACTPESNTSTTGKQQTPTKTARRVRVKCSTLGITTAEKKQLKLQLKRLADALDSEDGRRDASPPSPAAHIRQPQQQQQGRPGGGLNANQDETDQSSQRSQVSRVRWQLDSDLESERSWSLEPSGELGAGRNDLYRRFPQASPGASGAGRHSYAGSTTVGASLTDYESESSLGASDCSLTGMVGLRGSRPTTASGAESDSGIASKSAGKVTRKKSAGLRGRLTSTIRSISRSIAAGLGSDTEDSNSGAGGSSQRRARPSSLQGSLANTDDTKPGGSQSILKEIRV
jgi:chromosome segregation ATPase